MIDGCAPLGLKRYLPTCKFFGFFGVGVGVGVGVKGNLFFTIYTTYEYNDFK